jgi:hypothetical protein
LAADHDRDRGRRNRKGNHSSTPWRSVPNHAANARFELRRVTIGECCTHDAETARSAAELEEQIAVRYDVARSAQHARVAIDLDRQAEAPQLPPDERIPGHEHEQRLGNRESARIAGGAMLELVPQHQRERVGIERERPGRDHDGRIDHADERGTRVVRDHDGRAGNDIGMPAPTNNAKADDAADDVEQEADNADEPRNGKRPIDARGGGAP